MKLHAKLDYTSEGQVGPLITGDDTDAGVVSGKPARVILFTEGCFNSKRQGAADGGTLRETKGVSSL